MRIIRITPIFFILCVLSSGCKTVQKIQADTTISKMTTFPEVELRQYILFPESWINDDEEIIQKNISAAIKKVADANYNAVIFFLSENEEHLAHAIGEAHKYNLMIYAGIDHNWHSGEETSMTVPLEKTYIKRKINKLVTDYNIDGICIRLSGQTSDLTEDILVEAMLKKPYLINSILFSGSDEHQIADSCLDGGIVDFIIPFSDAGGSDFAHFPAKVPIPYNLKKIKPEYPASVRINEDSVKLYKTGIFFKRIILREGANRIRASVLTNDSASLFYEHEFNYQKSNKRKEPFPLWIGEGSVEPASDLELLPEDVIRISFNGSLGQEAFIEIKPGGLRIKCLREDYEDYSLYRTELPLQKLTVGKLYKTILHLVSAEGKSGSKTYEYALRSSIMIREAYDYPVVKITEENSRLTYNLGAPRLGGPVRSELGPGVMLKTNGKIGDNYRISLSSTENGIIHNSNVVEMSKGTEVPSYYISSMYCAPSEDADILTIPYLEPVPYEIYPDPDQRRIVVTLFGVKTASTWITHRTGRKIIDKITWEQTSPETYKIYINLKTPDIWGYDIHQNGKQLVVSLKYPPVYDPGNEKPLTGLKIAIEAGHGGSSIGARGLSGLLEKNINLDLSLKLGELCRSMGAEIIQIRESDSDMSLIEKRKLAITNGADLLISIHANAGGRGYLQVSGTSTYYNNPFWAPLAENIYDRLLEMDINEFGVIGSFNYTVIRASQMPSILVEQAFMSHAEDEEKLADPQFRQQMAQKIYEGIMDYLKYMKH